MYPSFEELRSERQRIVFSDHFERLCWPLRGTFPTALSVMETARGALGEMEPLQRRDGSWHEIAALPLTEPRVSSVNASVFMLDQYEADWVAVHKYHETAEYATYGDLDDETRPFGEQREDGTWESDSDIEYLARCCGQDRPVRKRDLKVQVKPANGNEFLTIQDYVSTVHPWMMSLREDIIQAMTVTRDQPRMGLESARAIDWKISVMAAPRHDILTHKMWLSDHTKPPPADEARLRKLRAAGTSRSLTRP